MRDRGPASKRDRGAGEAAERFLAQQVDLLAWRKVLGGGIGPD